MNNAAASKYNQYKDSWVTIVIFLIYYEPDIAKILHKHFYY